MRALIFSLFFLGALTLGVFLSPYFRFFGGTLIVGSQQPLPNGSVYQGETRDGLLQGQGRLTWSNGDYYEGAFDKGLFEGQGKINYAGRFHYEGQFHQGRLHGQGKLVSPLFTYEGEFEDDRMQGKGKLIQGEMEYEGEFYNDKRHGSGRLRYANGDRYEGEFKEDSPNGTGIFRLASGAFYEGEVKDGRFHGAGKYISGEHQYEGSFVDGQLTGKGSYTNGSWIYRGDFVNWRYQGLGELTTPRGVYIGQFEDGEIHGPGSFDGKKGESYQGEFLYGRYEGQGTYQDKNGTYIGEFVDGLYHGKGELRRTEPLDGISVYAGTWRYGRLVASDELEVYEDEELAEQVLYSQQALLDKAFSGLRAGTPKKIETYALLVAADGKQEVFRREVESISGKLEENGIAKNQQVLLVNTRQSGKRFPVATRISIDLALKALAEKMNEEDILLLYITTHGSRSHELAFDHRAFRAQDITPEGLRSSLDALPIRWKVAMVSACYSGGFVDALKSENTLVITAAAADRKSFGCSDTNDMTQFGRAYFDQVFNDSLNFVSFYHEARQLIAAWEKERGYKQSKPQIACSKAIYDHLAQQSKTSVEPYSEALCQAPKEPSGLLDSIKSFFDKIGD